MRRALCIVLAVSSGNHAAYDELCLDMWLWVFLIEPLPCPLGSHLPHQLLLPLPLLLFKGGQLILACLQLLAQGANLLQEAIMGALQPGTAWIEIRRP